MLKNAIMTAAAVIFTAGLAAPASAAAPMAPKAAAISAENAAVIEVGRSCRRCDRRDRRSYRRYSNRRHNSSSSFSLSLNFGSPGYYAPRYRAPRVVYYAAPAAWTPSWYTYCKTKYRSFNPHTGRYMTYSGNWQVCH